MGQRDKGSGVVSSGVSEKVGADSPPTIAALRRLFDSLPNFIAYVDSHQILQYANDVYCERFGLTQETVVGRHIRDVVGEEGYQTILPEIERVLAGVPLSYESFIDYNKGEEQFVRITYTPDVSDQGNIRGYYVFIVDLTEKHRTEKALKASEDRYRAFISQSSEGIWRFELEEPMPIDLPVDEQVQWAYKYGYLAECNDAMARQYGIESAPQIIGARLGDFLIEDDPNNIEFLKAFITSGYRLNDAESHERDTQGNERYFLNNFVGHIENGNLIRAWGTQRDITETKFADQAKATLAALVESSDDAIIGLDLNGIITNWNRSAEKFYGYSEKEILGKKISILIPEDRQHEEEGVFSHVLAGESVDHYETVRQAKDGLLLDVSLTISPIRDPSGRVIGASKIVRDISRRKKNERILNENRVMLAMAMQSSRMGVWERDIATGTITWSEELESIFGLQKGEFRGTEEHYYELIHEDDREAAWHEEERAIAEHRPYTIEFRFYHADGSIRWMETRGEAVYSKSGEPVRLYGIGIDVTSRKHTEEELKRQALLLEAALEPVIVWELGGRIIDWNRGAERLYGYSAAEAIGRVSSELLRTKFPVDSSEIESTLKKTGSWIGELTHISKFDEELVVESRHQLIELDGRFLVLETNRDITERKRVSEELRLSEARLQAMFDSTTAGFAVLDTSARFLQINDAFCKITGYLREEMLEMDFAVLTNPDDIASMNAGLERLLAGETPHFTFEERYRRKDGSLVWVQNNISLTRDSQNRPLHLIAITHDITARKKVEEELLLVSRVPGENPHPVLRLSPDGKVLYSNDAAAPMLESWKQASRQIPDDLMKQVRSAFNDGAKKEIEIEYRDRTVSCTIAPIIEAGYVNIYGTDITSRKMTVEALRESEQRFSRFMQQLPG
ncbi:MAG TPA: PAS domain S-box protein, partial [Pyrinomonadaceae bacterium]|nr:PAS domain S-box protein [Pyrinomonadaceae bacterium]